MSVFDINSTSKSGYFFIVDALGSPLTGLAYNSPGASAYYTRSGAAAVAITLATLASASAAWSSGGFKEVDATNAPGLYRLDLPNAALASGVDEVFIYLKFTGVNIQPLKIRLENKAVIVAAIWNELTSGYSTVGSFGKRFADNLDATVSSRAAASSLATSDGKIDAIKAVTDTLGLTAIADAIFKRDLTAITGAAMLSLRTVTARLISRTKVDSGTNELTVYDFNGTTKLIEQDATFDGTGKITDLSVGRTPN